MSGNSHLNWERRKYFIKGEMTKSGAAKLVCSEQYNTIWNNTKIFPKHEHCFKRNFKEAVLIEDHSAYSKTSIIVTDMWKCMSINCDSSMIFQTYYTIVVVFKQLN